MLPFALGVLGWTLAEYAMHRWLAHVARGRNDFSREHLRHHARRLYFTPTRRKVAAAVPALAVVGALAALLAGPPAGLAFTAGFGAMYVAYEVMHRRIHTHPPRGPYGRWMRRHHLHHHFGDPWSNHGVTSPLWDVVFRTRRRPGTIGVPRHLAMPWLVDADGALRPEHAPDYALGRRAIAAKPAVH
jgi:sterol desaturase/sphingolipid hydroxylase (fatty acid hydroxylase superfamily)